MKWQPYRFCPAVVNILFVTGIFPPDIGGPATYVPWVAAALVDRGHTVSVLTLGERWDDEDQRWPFEVVRVSRRLWKPWRVLKTVIWLIRLGRSKDVFFVNGLALEAVLANVWLKTPMVQKVVGDWAWEVANRHGWIRDDFEDFQGKKYDFRVEFVKRLRSWWLQCADRVIVPSRYLASWVAMWGTRADRVTVIYNSIPSEKEWTDISLPWRDLPTIIMVARLVRWKGIPAVVTLLANLPEVGLVVVGEGPERQVIEKLIQKLDLTRRVFLSGNVPQGRVSAYLRKADILVQNSTYEGLPHVLLEAMMAGTPVIATEVGGTSELVKSGQTGLLIKPGDGTALVAAVRKLLSDPELRARLARNAEAYCKSHFSFTALVEQTEAVLLSAAAASDR